MMMSISQLLNAANVSPNSESTLSSTTTLSSTSSIITIESEPTIKTKPKSNPYTNKPYCGRVGKLFKGPWRPSETALLARLVSKHGARNWSEIAQSIPGRTGKQARERWKNHLDPNLKKSAWSSTEDIIIIDGYRVHGNKWSSIARLIPGRSDNDVKNRFNCAIRSRLNLPPQQPNRKSTKPRGLRRLSNIFVPQELQWELDPSIKPPTMFTVFE